jgi:hypothetical protein
MMNVLQIQDDLKNFSEDQLIKEMQQPSGSAPQFLVLSELNRRKRVKGEFAARQAQQEPTVAEEVVAAAGVPQSGMMGMSEAMAPASVESGGIGSMMPKTMKMGGEVDSYAEGGLIEGIADSVSQNAQALENIQQATLQNAKLLQDQQNTPATQPTQQPNIQPRPLTPIATTLPARPFPMPRPPFGIGGKGGPRMPMNRFGVPPQQRLGTMRTRLGSSGIGQYGMAMARPIYSGFAEPQSMAEGGVIKASNGFAGTGKSADDIIKQMEEKDKAKINENTDVENISKDVPEQNTRVAGNTSNYIIEPDIIPLVSDSVEQDILNLQKGLQKERALDRALAIAQAGFGILASDAPTLGQAVGEGASTGLEAYRDANKRYQEGLIDLINARAKIASGRKKGKLTASDIMSNLNKTREQLYGKPGDLAYIQSEIDDKTRNQLAAQERYLMNLLKEDYGVNLPVATAMSS